ncbi:unnamed protein product [Mytilus coruscus]|uniref:DUF6570 domain-containing protein n=1 Tax=Mytilus coruscus TaxID=42192 RepID=A0A6J8AE51_MYTCO|nr:unnamed protein product [Mytilus coruscus]
MKRKRNCMPKKRQKEKNKTLDEKTRHLTKKQLLLQSNTARKRKARAAFTSAQLELQKDSLRKAEELRNLTSDEKQDQLQKATDGMSRSQKSLTIEENSHNFVKILKEKHKNNLADLTPLEKRLICRRYPFMKLIALPQGRLASLKGTFVNIPFNEQTVCSTLPRTPAPAGFIPVKLKRQLKYKTYEIFEIIRPQRVMTALRWLRQNNVLYRNTEECLNWEERSAQEDQ